MSPVSLFAIRARTPWLKAGNKNDRMDARKLSHLLRADLLTPVYHGESGVYTLKELSRSYLTVSKDLTRVMNRLKALYRSWAIPCAGQKVYSRHHRGTWLDKLSEKGVRRRAEQLYQQLDVLAQIRRQARKELLTESRRIPLSRRSGGFPAWSHPGGPVDQQTPHRFRTKRQLWAYCGLALETRSSGEYRFTEGQREAYKKAPALRGLNANHNHDLKNLFKSAATQAKCANDPLEEFYRDLLAKGMKPSMARLTVARKIAAIVLTIWKKEAHFDPGVLKPQTARA